MNNSISIIDALRANPEITLKEIHGMLNAERAESEQRAINPPVLSSRLGSLKQPVSETPRAPGTPTPNV